MNKINSVIIDDERANRELLASLIKSANPSFVITGEADSVSGGVQEILKQKPAVVFLDIRMGDGSGFVMLKKLDRIDFEVVFVSAFDEYALRAFDYNALDYLIKPINIRRLSETLKRIENRIGQNG